MSPLYALCLASAGAAGGALNSVAGGGSFIVFPTMLLVGTPAVTANATTAAALWPAGLGSVGPYRAHLPRERAALLVLALASFLGGAVGAFLLLATSDETFTRILPLLMLTAATIFTFGPRALGRGRGREGSAEAERGREPSTITARSLVLGASVQLVISTYGGYFGGGMGIMMLASFTLMGLSDIHTMNALKVVLGLVINGVALVGFVAAGKVVAAVAVPTAIGALAGGFFGASLARRVDARHVRSLVLVVAWSLTAWFTYRALRAG